MSNKLRDIFTKNADNVIKLLEQYKLEYRNNRDCFGCKHDKDLSDTYTTYHECEYGGPLPEEHTCLLWEDKYES